jgi:3-hydroxyisobutyrate dehydrogenase
VLSVLGRGVIHFGATGNGAIIKLINNFMCGVQAASFAEAMLLIQASGIDRGKAVSVLTNGAPGSPLVKVLSSRAEAADFAPNFELKLMAKDLAYASEMFQRAAHSDLQSAKAAREVFEQAIAAGYGEKDVSSVIEFLLQSATSQQGQAG